MGWKIGAVCVLLTSSIVAVVFATTIPMDDLEPFEAPCTLSVSESGSTRTMSWSAVTGAATYKVGRISDGASFVTFLAEVTGTTYADTTWDSGECYEYVMVAYDSSGIKVCSAHVTRVGTCF